MVPELLVRIEELKCYNSIFLYLRKMRPTGRPPQSLRQPVATSGDPDPGDDGMPNSKNLGFVSFWI
jgi:hypothetical protein